MFELNPKIRDLIPYEPISGTYPVRLDANESFFPLPEFLKNALCELPAKIAFNRYPDPLASSLSAAAAAYYGVKPENITAGNGSDELISVICTAFLMRGDAMLTLEPDFSMYAFYGSLDEARCVTLRKNADLTISPDAVINLCRNQNIKLLIFSNPCNPTSLGLKKEEVRRIISGVDALVVLDEAYMDFWDQSLLSEVNAYPNLILLRTCSKAFGMAGLRLGIACANARLTAILRAVKSPYNLSSFTQAAGVCLFEHADLLAPRIESIKASRTFLCSELKKLEAQFPERFSVYESVTNFVLLASSRAAVYHKALLSNGLCVRFFPGYLRVTCGNEEENTAFLSQFETILREEPSW